MSNRYGQGRQQDHNNNKGFIKTQKKFVPRNSTPNLSTSLRDKQQSGSASGTSSNSSGRVQSVGNVKFVKYLPQDEAVAAGLGAEDGGLDPIESQKVVDLLNTLLSRLLKLKPKDFWKQGTSFFSNYSFQFNPTILYSIEISYDSIQPIHY